MKKRLSIIAPPMDVMDAIRKLDSDHSYPESSAFDEQEFSFTMRSKRHNRMYGYVRVRGTVEQKGNECIIDYSVKPGFIAVVFFCIFFLTFICLSFVSLYSAVPIESIIICGGISLVIYLLILGDLQICDSRFTRKIHELETSDTSF